jgi:hypothetical protein
MPNNRSNAFAARSVSGKPNAGIAGRALSSTGPVTKARRVDGSNPVVIGSGVGSSGRRAGRRRCGPSKSRWPRKLWQRRPCRQRKRCSWRRTVRARASAQPPLAKIFPGCPAGGRAVMCCFHCGPVCRSSVSVAACAVERCGVFLTARHAGMSDVGSVTGAMVGDSVRGRHPTSDVFADCRPILPEVLCPHHQTGKGAGGFG